MIGALLSRLLVMVLGYVYPAYECYKTVEKEKTEIHQLIFWCQYWILVALITVCERLGDVFVSWIPLYDEAKVALFIYLWYPRTRGAMYVYNTMIKPYIAKHQSEIESKLLDMKNRVVKTATLFFHKATHYGQIKFLEAMQYAAASSSASRTFPPADQVKSNTK